MNILCNKSPLKEICISKLRNMIKFPGGTILIQSNIGNELEMLPIFSREACSRSESPEFIINGVVKFQFKFELSHFENSTNQFIYHVRFSKTKPKDKRNYYVTYTHWSGEVMTFVAVDGTWQFVYTDSSIPYPQKETISVVVNVAPLFHFHNTTDLYEDTKLTDFKLVGIDGCVPVHKAIMAAHSPVLKNMLKGKWKETAEGAIGHQNVTLAVLQHFKEYMYLGTVDKNSIKDLLLLSNLYKMEDLESRCIFLLRAGLTEKNVIDLMIFAGSQKQVRLLNEILDSVYAREIKIEKIQIEEETSA